MKTLSSRLKEIKERNDRSKWLINTLTTHTNTLLRKYTSTESQNCKKFIDYFNDVCNRQDNFSFSYLVCVFITLTNHKFIVEKSGRENALYKNYSKKYSEILGFLSKKENIKDACNFLIEENSLIPIIIPKDSKKEIKIPCKFHIIALIEIINYVLKNNLENFNILLDSNFLKKIPWEKAEEIELVDNLLKNITSATNKINYFQTRFDKEGAIKNEALLKANEARPEILRSELFILFIAAINHEQTEVFNNILSLAASTGQYSELRKSIMGKIIFSQQNLKKGFVFKLPETFTNSLDIEDYLEIINH